ncbi:hypothetical protein CE91St43_02780 [Oscillospiraceae bacterium]|nr:hypothetical protein CE91St43_02780 [Oscillospiraceae bacterium]
MKIFKKIDSFFETIEEYILLITGTVVTLMILASAVFRFIKFDWFGSEELTLIVGVWLYFVGSICAARNNTHISGDMLNMFISNKQVVFLFNVIRDAVSIAMAAVFTVWTFQFLTWQISLGASTAVYKLPNFISLIPIPLFFAFWVVYLIRNLVILIQSRPGQTAQVEEGGAQA